MIIKSDKHSMWCALMKNIKMALINKLLVLYSNDLDEDNKKYIRKHFQ